MSTPRISVQVMVFNSERYLAHTLESLRQQTFKDFEVLMHDSASQDRSAEICAQAARQDSRFRHLRREEKLSIGQARAEAFSESQGDYIAVLDSDDLAHPQRFEQQRAWLERNPETVLLASYYRVINKNGFPLRLWPIHFQDDIEIRWRVTFGNCLTHSTVMYRRAAAQAIGGYDAHLATGEDIDFYGRFLTQGRFHVLNKPLVHYRDHQWSLSNTEPSENKETFSRLVQQAIRTHMEYEVSQPVAAAIYNQSSAPAQNEAVARESLELLRKGFDHFCMTQGSSAEKRILLGRSAFLHALQFMTKNEPTSWWAAIEPLWHDVVRHVALDKTIYDWRRDSGLVLYAKNLLKTSPRALLLSLS